MEKMIRSVCPYDCPDSCGLLLTVQDQEVKKVQGDPDHPYTRGAVCGKMAHYEKTIHSPKRLKTPLLRIGPKGTGQFREATWEEALSVIQQKWQKVIEQEGAEAILPYSYAGTMGFVQNLAGHAFFHKLGASQLLRTICSPAKDAGWKAVMGDTPAMTPEEAAYSDYIIIWGMNPVATNLHFLRDLQKARQNGAKVILIETYRTKAAAYCDEVILVKPGSDGALALGMMHLLVEQGLFDKKFIEEKVLGFAGFRDSVLPDYTPSKVSALTGVPVEVLTKLASDYGQAEASYIHVGSGLSRYGNGAMTIRSIVALPALTGAWQKKGGGCFCSTSVKRAFDLNQITRQDFMIKNTRSINMNQLGEALTSLIPPVKSLFVYNTNPAVVAPDQNKVIAGLSRDDLFTVVHERFMTDTALYADVVLPATTSAEHNDLYRGYGHYYIQRVSPAIAPVGESKSNWSVFQLLAQKFGFEDDFFRLSENELIDRALARPAKLRGNKQPKAGEKALTLDIPEKLAEIETPSGKIELYNERLSEVYPVYKAPYGGKGSLKLVIAPHQWSLNSTFNEQEELVQRKQEPLIMMSPTDAARRGLQSGQVARIWNELGDIQMKAFVTDDIPVGTVVAEGLWYLKDYVSGRSVNALLSQKLTDLGEGSTLSDNTVEVEPYNL